MARISGVDIPREKRVEIALTYIYGVGLTRSQKILASTGVSPDTRVKDLSDADVQKLRAAAAEGRAFDLAVLDMQMPGMDGEALGRAIKDDAQLQDTVLVP